MNVQIRFQCFGDGVILPIWEPPPEPAEPAPRRGTKVRGCTNKDEARAAIGDDSESSARIAWESVDAERVNRLLRPWAERRRIQKLTERYQAKAKQDKQKKRLVLMKKQLQVIEKHECDLWLATTTEVQRQAEELHMMGDEDDVRLHMPGYGVSLHSSMVIDLTLPEFVDLSDA